MATLVSRVAGVPLDGVGRVTVRTTSASSVRLKVGTDSGVSSGVIFGSSVTPNAQGDSQLTVSGLAAATQYYYRIEMTDSGGGGAQLDAGSVGKFRTAPAANTAASFAFDFGSCATGESASMAAIAARNDDLFFHLGDLYYHDASGTDIANFRTRMSARLQLANHQSLFSTMPVTYTPSDHDGMNNDGTYGADPTAWTNWNQVYREMFPTPVLAGTMGVYYTFAWGRIRFIHTDSRSFKSNPADTDNSSKTALGTTQKQWLKDQITNATEPVIVIIQDNPWISSASAGDDAWAGYTTERSELATFFQNSGKNIGMLAGDMHALAADDGTNAPGGIFVFHAAPLKGTSSLKGGPYSVSPYPSTAGVAADQYGRVVVTDSSTQISLAFTGYSSDNTARISLTKTFTVSPPASTPPTPTGLAATAASTSQIDVSWNSSSGATGYDLEVDGVVVDKATALTHQHTGLSASTNHDYRVRAKNANGTSAWSSIVSATTLGSGGSGITLTGSPSRVEQATGSSLVLTVPTGAAIGEVLVAQIASTTNTVVAPSGWTQIAQVNQAGPISSCGYYRVVTGSETASYTWTGTGSDRSTGIMQRFAGVDTTTPIDVTASTAGSTGTQTTLTIPSITTVTAGAMLLSGTTLYSSVTSVLVPPTGMTAIITTTGTGRRTTLAYESRPTTGATGTRIWTNNPVTSLDYAGWMVALRPATIAPATPTGLAAVAASSSQIDVSWNSVSGATGYDLEVDSVIIDKATALTHQHTGLTANTSHDYRVRAKNANGTSAWSSIVSATTNASSGALALRGVGTTFSSAATTSYVLSTHSSTVIGDLLVATMTIDELASLVTVTPPSGWTAAFTPLQSAGGSLTHVVYWRAAATAGAVNYTFTLSVAYKGSGNIATFSGADTTTPFAGSVTAQGTGNVSLSLPAPSANNCIIITGFAVNHDAITYTYSTPSGWTNDWTAAGQQANLFYHQPILQTTAAAASFASTISPTFAQRWIGWIAAIQPSLPPPTPTGLAAAVISSGQINTSWNSSATATGYDLEVDSVVIDKATSLTHQHTGLAPGSSHNYRIRAKNAVGASAWSSIVSATTLSGGGAVTIALTGTVSLVEQATGSDSITVTVPTGAVVGEVLITQIASSTNTVATPTGWTLIAQANETSAPISSSGYYRIVTGSESASYIWTGVGTGRATGIMQRFSGVNTTTPLDVTAASAISAVATSFTVPSITTVTAGAMMLNGVVLNAATAAALVPPGTMTAITTTAGTGRRTTLAYESRPTAGATGSRIWTENPTTTPLQFAGWTVALQPASVVMTVTDLWNGSILIRQRLERWNGTALSDIVAETKAP